MRNPTGWICATLLLCTQFAACGGLGENKTPCEAIYDALWRGQRDYCSGESGCCACECINEGKEYDYYTAEDGCLCEAREALTEDGCNNLLAVYGACEDNPESCVYDGRNAAESACFMSGY